LKRNIMAIACASAGVATYFHCKVAVPKGLVILPAGLYEQCPLCAPQCVAPSSYADAMRRLVHERLMVTKTPEGKETPCPHMANPETMMHLWNDISLLLDADTRNGPTTAWLRQRGGGERRAPRIQEQPVSRLVRTHSSTDGLNTPDSAMIALPPALCTMVITNNTPVQCPTTQAGLAQRSQMASWDTHACSPPASALFLAAAGDEDRTLLLTIDGAAADAARDQEGVPVIAKRAAICGDRHIDPVQ
jgi:hypothetical protein